MDAIKQAVELARSADKGPRQNAGGLADLSRSDAAAVAIREVRLSDAHLSENRIVAQASSSPQGRYYDMLRTQVLQEMDKKNWQFLAVTSATPACGKTVTACNLAMSIARLPEHAAMLVDLDMHKPRVSEYLGIKPSATVSNVLEGTATLSEAIVHARIGPNSLIVLPGSPLTSGASEWMASQTMAGVLQTIKREFRSRTVIYDLPPMLTGDDVISILPRMDAVLLVAGIGITSVSDLKECQKHLQRTPIIRVVVNKCTDAADSYYGYY